MWKRERRRRRTASSDQFWTPEPLRSRVIDSYPLSIDVAACAQSTLVPDNWLGPTHASVDRREALSPSVDWAALAGDGWCWMNCPYDRRLAKFVEKACQTAAASTGVVALLPVTALSTHYWARLVHGTTARVEVLPGRLRYDTPSGVQSPAPWGSVLVEWPPLAGGRGHS